VVPATSTLVDQGTRVGEIVAAHPAEVVVLSAVDKHTAAAPAGDPADAAAGAKAVGEIAKAPGTTVPQSIQLLQSLGAPDVQCDLALVSRYGGILTAANAAIPADDPGLPPPTATRWSGPSRTTPVSGSAGGGSASSPRRSSCRSSS
jgi:hypothetical protein